ncbi:hypothetical protein VNO78_07694 [Psophocarpus tetragonolobus]|uniref:Aluminum-activated malate transporter n=1 Tax=Psophocarpus tetragonolobus TaxID=3891 RepID=A0AAN9T3M3_PSOTE
MDRKNESIEIDIPTKPELPRTGTKSGANNKSWLWIQSVCDFCKEDAGREIFALKVGLAVALVSLLTLFEAPYQVFGPNIVWAILSAIIVFEDTVGATFNRALNRALGGSLAGILAIAVAQTALSSGHVAEPIIVGLSMFMIAVITSYMKMWQALVQYEYGFRVALQSYCLIIVSGYRIGNPINTMIQRLYSIAFGGMVSVLVNVSIFPMWAGEQLHKELVKDFDSVADSLQECVKKYLECGSEKSKITMASIDGFPDEPAYERCLSILNSGSKLDTLASSAKWEPPHGRFLHISYPWSQYVKVGAVLRHCAYQVMALHSFAHAQIQVPYKLRVVFQSEIQEVSNQVSEIIRILGRDINHMKWSLKMSHITRLRSSTKRLQTSLYFQYSYILTSTFESPVSDKPLKSFANIWHTFYHTPYEKGFIEQTKCYHEITRKQLRRVYSWPSREVDAFEEDSEKRMNLLLRNMKALESTATLSLLTNFTSSFVELVARVDPLINVVNELSKMAKFKPDDDVL